MLPRFRGAYLQHYYYTWTRRHVARCDEWFSAVLKTIRRAEWIPCVAFEHRLSAKLFSSFLFADSCSEHVEQIFTTLTKFFSKTPRFINVRWFAAWISFTSTIGTGVFFKGTGIASTYIPNVYCRKTMSSLVLQRYTLYTCCHDFAYSSKKKSFRSTLDRAFHNYYSTLQSDRIYQKYGMTTENLSKDNNNYII